MRLRQAAPECKTGSLTMMVGEPALFVCLSDYLVIWKERVSGAA